jgi:FtsH-binding integral membrane protein
MPYAESSILKKMKGGCNCGVDLNFLGMKGGAKNGKGVKNHFFDLIMQKKEFLLLLFSNLIAQLGISYYLMMNYKGPHINVWLILFSTIAILTLIIFVPMPPFMKFLLFCAFSALLGINLSVISSKDKDSNNGQKTKDIVHLAMLETIAVFGAMFLVGAFLLFSGIRLGLQFSLFLFFSLLLFILTRLYFTFSGTINLHIIAFSFIGVILFSFYVIYDTNVILRRDYYGDFITASMDYYLDILNLFTNLFNLNNQ